MKKLALILAGSGLLSPLAASRTSAQTPCPFGRHWESSNIPRQPWLGGCVVDKTKILVPDNNPFAPYKELQSCPAGTIQAVTNYPNPGDMTCKIAEAKPRAPISDSTNLSLEQRQKVERDDFVDILESQQNFADVLNTQLRQTNDPNQQAKLQQQLQEMERTIMENKQKLRSLEARHRQEKSDAEAEARRKGDVELAKLNEADRKRAEAEAEQKRIAFLAAEKARCAPYNEEFGTFYRGINKKFIDMDKEHKRLEGKAQRVIEEQEALAGSLRAKAAVESEPATKDVLLQQAETVEADAASRRDELKTLMAKHQVEMKTLRKSVREESKKRLDDRPAGCRLALELGQGRAQEDTASAPAPAKQEGSRDLKVASRIQ